MKLTDIAPEHRRLRSADWDTIVECARGNYLEVGTNHGASTCAALEGGAINIVTIDIYDWQPKVYDSLYVCFFKGTSVDWAEGYIRNHGQDPMIDCLFIDGSHEYEYVMKDCQALIPLVKPGGFVLFHDYNPNNPNTGVYRAVNDYLKGIEYEHPFVVPNSGNMFRIQKL